MRAKRSKKYRKLMHQYEMAFGFREPYQVLVDSNFLRAVHSFKMELIPALERTLQGKVKPCMSSNPESDHVWTMDRRANIPINSIDEMLTGGHYGISTYQPENQQSLPPNASPSTHHPPIATLLAQRRLNAH
jgi:hypothetical protein